MSRMTSSHIFKRLLVAGTAAMYVATTAASAVQAEAVPYRTASAPQLASSQISPSQISQGGAMRVTTQSAPVRTQVLNLPKGRSAVIDLPADASDVFVSNPAVADAVLRTPRRIFVLGVAAGQSDAIFFDAMGRQILNLSVRVDAATDGLNDTVRRLFPRSHVDIQSLNGHIILSGMARDDGEADQIARLAQTFVDKPENVLNLMTIAGKDQVTLQVRVVEVNHNTVKQLGLSSDITYNNGTRSYSFGRSSTYGTNGNYLGGKGACYGQNAARTTTHTDGGTITNTTGTNASNTATTTGKVSSAQGYTENHINAYNADNSARDTYTGTGSNLSNDGNLVGSATSSDVESSAVNGVTSSLSNAVSNAVSTAYSTVTGTNNATCLEAFERVGLARTLAEPNLTAISGESAKFLAGGEFPVPVGQDSQGRITVEFKPFGVGLGFTPVVMSGGRISLKISTEVSELTNVGALQLNSTLTIPGLTVRRAETTVEMSSGSSLMIAGLLQTKYKQSIDSMPGLTTLPIIGSLFRSRDFLNDETEMVVMVTPYLVDPTNPNVMQTPADNLQAADDLSSAFMGSLNKVIKARDTQNGTAAATTAPAAAGPYRAPIGYVIE